MLGPVRAGDEFSAAKTPTRLELRSRTLRAIEDGHGAEAEIAEIVSVAISRCHLRTMARLESSTTCCRGKANPAAEILDAAFAAIERARRNSRAGRRQYAGCWVMKLEVGEGGTTVAPESLGGEG